MKGISFRIINGKNSIFFVEDKKSKLDKSGFWIDMTMTELDAVHSRIVGYHYLLLSLHINY